MRQTDQVRPGGKKQPRGIDTSPLTKKLKREKKAKNEEMEDVINSGEEYNGGNYK